MVRGGGLLAIGGNRHKLERDSTLFRRAIGLPILVDGLGSRVNSTSVRTFNIDGHPEGVRNDCVPYFLTNRSTTRTTTTFYGTPLFGASRRIKRVLTTLCSTNGPRLVGRPFVTFRISNNAARTILMAPSSCRVVGTRVISRDASLGTNRTVSEANILLNLSFPYKPTLRGLSGRDGRGFGVGPAVLKIGYSLSNIRGGIGGVVDSGHPPYSITGFTLYDITRTLSTVTRTIVRGCNSVPVIFTNNISNGGVVTSVLSSQCNTFFTGPRFDSSGTTKVTVCTCLGSLVR